MTVESVSVLPILLTWLGCSKGHIVSFIYCSLAHHLLCCVILVRVCGQMQELVEILDSS